LFSTRHWQRIVNGFGRQEPADHAARMTTLARFPDDEALDLMRRIGVRYVVLHTSRASELVDRVKAAQASNGTQLISSEGGDFMFEVRRGAWSDP
jgi:sugar phosphate isomerase/epimerase